MSSAQSTVFVVMRHDREPAGPIRHKGPVLSVWTTFDDADRDAKNLEAATGQKCWAWEYMVDESAGGPIRTLA